MFDVKEKPRLVQRALLLRVYNDKRNESVAEAMLEELGELVDTLGIPVLDSLALRCPKMQAKLLLGTGKAEEVKTHAKALDIDCIVFDNELTPAQQRNWESLTDITTLDRQEIILDIFAQRASTKEAQLQVELARMEYTLPRLARHWSHLGRQGGSGPAAKGEGEKQIEIDRRLIRRRIDRLKQELEEVRQNRRTQRKERRRVPIPQAAIVGYTNAGKSSLLRAMTGAEVLVADKLFATLDPTTRRVELPNGAPLLLTDTVGFVRNLPHRLVEAFKATLEEAVLAEFLVHVLDASHPEVGAFAQTTLAVLKELGAEEKKIITLFNKVDLIENPGKLTPLRNAYPHAIFGSIHTGEGMEMLLARMAAMVADRMVNVTLRLPHREAGLLNLFHQHGRVDEEIYEYDYISVRGLLPARLRERVAPYEAV